MRCSNLGKQLPLTSASPRPPVPGLCVEEGPSVTTNGPRPCLEQGDGGDGDQAAQSAALFARNNVKACLYAGVLPTSSAGASATSKRRWQELLQWKGNEAPGTRLPLSLVFWKEDCMCVVKFVPGARKEKDTCVPGPGHLQARLRCYWRKGRVSAVCSGFRVSLIAGALFFVFVLTAWVLLAELWLFQPCAEAVVRAFMTSKLDNCDVLFYGLPAQRLHRLQLFRDWGQNTNSPTVASTCQSGPGGPGLAQSQTSA